MVKDIRLKVVFLSILFSVSIVNKTFSKQPVKEVLTVALTDEASRKFDYFLFEASRFKMQGDSKQALRAYQQCLHIDETSAISIFEIGNIYLAQKDLKTAIPYFERAVELSPDNDWYLSRLAQIYQKQENFEAAIGLYKRLIKLSKDDDEYRLYVLGSLYTSSEQYQKAIDIYDKIEALSGINESLRIEKQRLYLLLKNKKKAAAEITDLIKINPTITRYHIIYGDYLVEIGNLKKAFKSYTTALEIDADNGPLHLSLSGYYEAKGDSVKSLQELKKAFLSDQISFQPKLRILLQFMMQVSEDTSNVETVLDLSNILLELYPEEEGIHYYYGNFLLNIGNYDEAKRELLEVLKVDPSKSDVWLQVISIDFQEGNFDSIYKLGTQALVHDPISPVLYYYTGLAAHQINIYDKAIELYEKGLLYADSKPSLQVQFYSNLADVYYQNGNKIKSYSYFDKALTIDDHNIIILNNYSYYLSLDKANLDKAERMSSKCVELEPGNATYLDTYAWILYKLKNYSLARFYIEKAMENGGDTNDIVVEHYADILFKLEEFDLALQYWLKSKLLGNTSELLERKIESKQLIIE